MKLGPARGIERFNLMDVARGQVSTIEELETARRVWVTTYRIIMSYQKVTYNENNKTKTS